METSIIPATNDDAIQRVIDALKAGETVSFPTDTVYGLGVDPFNISAIIKLFEAKGRDYNKAIAILVGNTKQVNLIAEMISDSAQKLIDSFWPGGLTVIVPKKKSVPDLLSSNQSIGIRMPDHPITLQILNEFGPLATSSANVSGKQNPISAGDVYKQLNGRISLILDGGTCPGGIPSTVVDCLGEKTQVLRNGAIDFKKIESLLELKP
jgi:L-threonylcarbamoyladenylate synthase